MPSKSKSQQRFFGMVDAYKKGELKNPGKKIKKAADSMSASDVKDFAKTKHNNLPEKVDENIIRLTESDLHDIIRESVKNVLNEGWVDDRYEYDHFSDEGNGGLEEYGVNIAQLINGMGSDSDSLHALGEEVAMHLANGSDKEQVLRPFIEGLIAVYKNPKDPYSVYKSHGIKRN